MIFENLHLYLSKLNEFVNFGITDSSIFSLGNSKYLILTDDLTLSKHLENNNVPDRIMTYDGEESRNITYRKTKNKLNSLYCIISDRLHYDTANCDPFFLTSVLFDMTINHLNDGKATILENTEKDGNHILKFSIYNGQLAETYWFSKEKMYNPIKIIRKSDITKEITNFDYMEKNGQFVPQNILHVVDHADGRNILTKQLIINPDCQVNVDLPDTLFTINFPEGIKISDRRK